MAIKDAPIVNIIEFDEKKAYNPDRPISSLIRTQLLHLHHAEHIVVPQKERTDININTLHTERQASEYIQRVTALLHKHVIKAAKKSKPAKEELPSARGKSKNRKRSIKKKNTLHR